MIEQWKDIKGYEGLYKASSEGLIYSIPRANSKGGLIAYSKNHQGYYTVTLAKNGINTTYRVNRLIWKTFNSEIPEGLQVDHINSVRTDNRLENLQLLTPKENLRKARAIPVNGIDKDGNIVIHFDAIYDSENTEYSHSCIARCIKGERKTHKGLHWVRC